MLAPSTESFGAGVNTSSDTLMLVPFDVSVRPTIRSYVPAERVARLLLKPAHMTESAEPCGKTASDGKWPTKSVLSSCNVTGPGSVNVAQTLAICWPQREVGSSAAIVAMDRSTVSFTGSDVATASALASAHDVAAPAGAARPTPRPSTSPVDATRAIKDCLICSTHFRLKDRGRLPPRENAGPLSRTRLDERAGADGRAPPQRYPWNL